MFSGFRNKITVCSLFLSLTLVEITHAEIDDDNAWFFEDFEEQIDLVSEGELRFLKLDPADKSHSHHNQISISKKSLETGWSIVEQCHNNLDALSAVQITFNEKTTRNHKIESSSKIERVWVDGTNIELERVEKGAALCLRFETKNVHRQNNGSYLVKNGPYMRRFLDGYYPLNVKLAVNYPCDVIQFVRTKHLVQPGFEVNETKKKNACSVIVNAFFEGQLYTRLSFKSSMD